MDFKKPAIIILALVLLGYTKYQLRMANVDRIFLFFLSFIVYFCVFYWLDRDKNH